MVTPPPAFVCLMAQSDISVQRYKYIDDDESDSFCYFSIDRHSQKCDMSVREAHMRRQSAPASSSSSSSSSSDTSHFSLHQAQQVWLDWEIEALSHDWKFHELHDHPSHYGGFDWVGYALDLPRKDPLINGARLSESVVHHYDDVRVMSERLHQFRSVPKAISILGHTFNYRTTNVRPVGYEEKLQVRNTIDKRWAHAVDDDDARTQLESLMINGVEWWEDLVCKPIPGDASTPDWYGLSCNTLFDMYLSCMQKKMNSNQWSHTLIKHSIARDTELQSLRSAFTNKIKQLEGSDSIALHVFLPKS